MTAKKAIDEVRDGCKVKAWITEYQKETLVSVDLEKRPFQKFLIGKKIGDSFTLQGVNLQYRITGLWMEEEANGEAEQEQKANPHARPLTTFQSPSVSLSHSTSEGSPKIIPPVFADTHAKFLNRVFRTNMSQFYRAYWNYHGNKELGVWMIRLDGEINGWENRLLDSGTVKESYVGGELASDWYFQTRIVVSVEDGTLYSPRRYRILGIFRYSSVDSCPRKYHIYRKIPNEIAVKMVPEIFQDR